MSDKEKVSCSFCNSTNVQRISLFGTAQLVKQYYCQACKSAFEFIKWQPQPGIPSQGSTNKTKEIDD